MTVWRETSVNNRPWTTKKRLNTCIRTQFSYLSSTYSILISIRFFPHYSRLEGFVPHTLTCSVVHNPRACASLPLFPAGVCVFSCGVVGRLQTLYWAFSLDQWPAGAARWENYIDLCLSLSSYCDSVISLLISRFGRQLYPRCHGYTHVRLVPLHYS